MRDRTKVSAERSQTFITSAGLMKGKLYLKTAKTHTLV